MKQLNEYIRGGITERVLTDKDKMDDTVDLVYSIKSNALELETFFKEALEYIPSGKEYDALRSKIKQSHKLYRTFMGSVNIMSTAAKAYDK